MTLASESEQLQPNPAGLWCLRAPEGTPQESLSQGHQTRIDLDDRTDRHFTHPALTYPDGAG